MQERIIIKNFAGIKSIELDLRQINILIGPQASGKSICAKLLYFFKNFIHELEISIEKQPTKKEFDASLVEKFEDYFPPDSLAPGKFSIRYELGKAFIEVKRKKTKIYLSYSDDYIRILDESRKHLSKLRDEKELERHDYFRARKYFSNKVEKEIGEIALSYQRFIPAGRSFFANVQSNIFSILSDNLKIDPFLTEFGSLYEIVKNNIDRRPNGKNGKGLEGKLDTIIESILCGKHVRKKRRDFIKLHDGRLTEISNSSSGQQEILPLAILLKYFSLLKFRSGGQCYYIEEPEAHLFPTAQRNIVEFIATVFNTAASKSQFFITTHSPYILTAFNNLLHAGLIDNKLPKNRKKELHKIVPPEQALNPDNVRVYALDGGKAKDICCDDTGLIDTNIIDDVSNDLSIQFGHLLELE